MAGRIADVREAIADPAVDALWCSRGGFGSMQLLQALAGDAAFAGKWCVGLSDITALHQMRPDDGLRAGHPCPRGIFRSGSVSWHPPSPLRAVGAANGRKSFEGENP